MNIWMILFVITTLVSQAWNLSGATSNIKNKPDGYLIAVYLVGMVMYGGFWLLLSLTGFWSLW